MRIKRSLLGLAVFACFSALAFPQAPSEVFRSFDFPGSTNTQATAITPSGEIVGRYFTADGNQHGFVYATACSQLLTFLAQLSRMLRGSMPGVLSWEAMVTLAVKCTPMF